MAHPFANHRQTKVEHNRVSSITKGYADGGAVAAPVASGSQTAISPVGKRDGGAVKSGPAWEEGKRLGTQVQHSGNKSDGKDIGRGKPITYASGGPIEAPAGKKGMGPKLPGGGRGGLARLAKAHRAAAGK